MQAQGSLFFGRTLRREDLRLNLPQQFADVVRRALALIEHHRWSEAVKALQRGVDLKPHYGEADARLFLGEALLASGDRSRAREQFERVVRMEPSYPSHNRPMEAARRKLAELAGPSD